MNVGVETCISIVCFETLSVSCEWICFADLISVSLLLQNFLSHRSWVCGQCKYLFSNWSLTNIFVCSRIRFNTRFLDSHVKITTKNILREEKYFCMHDWYWIIHKAKNIPGIISYIFQLIFLLLLLLTLELVTINLRLTITYCYFFSQLHIFIANVITW